MGKRGITRTVVAVAIVAILAAASVVSCSLTKPAAAEGLQLVFKDYGVPEVKQLQLTIKGIQLQRAGGEWITLKSYPDGLAVTVAPDGAEVPLGRVNLEAGTYIGTRLLVASIYVEVDVNRDGDTLDTNVEIVVPVGTPAPMSGVGMEELAQLKLLTDQIKPLMEQLEQMGVPPPGEGPPPGGLTPEAQALIVQIDGLRAQIKELIGGELPRVKEGRVYTGKYLDEKFSVTWPPPEAPEGVGPYMRPPWEVDFVYDGSGGKILYDLTLHPLKPRHEQISIKVSTTT